MVPVKLSQKLSATPVIKLKTANSKITMKAVKPERPKTTATHTFRSKVTVTASNITSPPKVDTIRPKPKKWDLKHCLETKAQRSILSI